MREEMKREMSLEAAREIIRYALHHGGNSREKLNRMGYWVAANHQITPVWKMDRDHLANVYRFLRRRMELYTHPFSRQLIQEMDDRMMFFHWPEWAR